MLGRKGNKGLNGLGGEMMRNPSSRITTETSIEALRTAIRTAAACTRLFDLPLTRRDLETHAAALGSDCAFFVRGGCALASGRGERLEPIENRLSRVELVVVWPGLAASTARAYERVRPEHFQDDTLARRASSAIRAGNLSELQETKWNVFDKIVIDSSDKIYYRKVQDRMRETGLFLPGITGSGSAVYGFAENRAHAHAARDRLQLDYPVVFAGCLRHVGVRCLPGMISTWMYVSGEKPFG